MPQADRMEVVVIVTTLLGAFGVKEIIVWYLNRRKSNAETEHLQAQEDNLIVSSSREVINILREELQGSREVIGELRGDLGALRLRVDTLEERERHQLVRSAVHESWDQIAHAKLLTIDPNFPSPPPLTGHSHLEAVDQPSLFEGYINRD